MAYAIGLDWYDNPEKWENHGRNVLEQHCKHKDQDKSSKRNNRETNMRYSGYCNKCETCEDSAKPMMNYGYLLDLHPDDKMILQIVKRTNCTVMENTENGDWFLVLCGGGMNLSQDIALAYHLAQRWIPCELALNISTQKGLSIGGKDWYILKKAMRESLSEDNKHIQNALEEWR